MTVSETIKRLLDSPIKDEKTKEDLMNIGIDNPTFQDFVVLMVLTRTANEGGANDLYALASLLGETR